MEENKKKNVKLIIIIAIILLIVIAGVIYISKRANTNNDNNSNNSSVGDSGILTKKDEVKIVKSETKTIKYTDFDNGLIKMKIPEGWKVDILLNNYVMYTLRVYNPENPLYQFFFSLKTEGYNKSKEAQAFQQKYYPNDYAGKMPVIEDKTTEGFYKAVFSLNKDPFPILKDFTVIDNLGNGPFGGDMLRASFKDGNGNEGEGVFTGYVFDAGAYYVPENFLTGKQIDIYFLSVYDAMFVSAPKGELVNWQEPLNTVASSLEFTDTFMNAVQSQLDAQMKTFNNIRSICNEISDGIMDSWEKRSASFDIMSQKQSDATLGYERVYDTETNEIYKAYNGFTDDYDGKRYKSITDDMYTKGIDGYIEKVY